MDLTSINDYVLLIAGLGIFLGISIGVILPNILPTPRGRLNRQSRELRHRLYELQQAERLADKANRTYDKLKQRADRVQPNKLRDAEVMAEDRKTMLGHARDKVMAAQNHVRNVVLNEYPPVYQESLLKKHLPEQNQTGLSGSEEVATSP